MIVVPGKHERPRPFLKWAGGKRSLLAHILPRLPARNAVYYEPFLGGGAVFLALASAGAIGRAVLGDRNPELVNAWTCVRDEPEGLIEAVRALGTPTKERFYEVRAQVCETALTRAARMLWLNRTCFNGLYRLNSKGQFNVPYGRYARPQYIDEANILEVSAVMRATQVEIREGDFDAILPGDDAPRSTVYLDPPYMPVSATSSFTAYDHLPFGLAEHTRLADGVVRLRAAGHQVLLSNSITDESTALYASRRLNMVQVGVRRSINRDAAKRGKVGEYLVGANLRLRGPGIPPSDWDE